MPELVVEAGDVGARDVGHPQLADRRQDEAAEVAAVLPRRKPGLRRTAMCSLIESPGQLGDGDGGASLSSVASRVLALLDGGEEAERQPTRALFGGQHTVQAEAHAPVALALPVLDDVGAPAAGQDADGEALQLVVADDVVAEPEPRRPRRAVW